MQRKKIWKLMPVVVAMAAVLVAFAALSLFWNRNVALGELAASAIVIIVLLIRMRGVQNDIRSAIMSAAEDMGASERQTLLHFPLPSVVITPSGEMVWYNELFQDTVIGGADLIGTDIRSVAKTLNLPVFDRPGAAADVNLRNRRFTVYGSRSDNGLMVLYWVENTELKNLVDEYRESRPVVAIILIDNYDELMQNAKEGEKGEILNRIEKTLRTWAAETSGFLSRSDRDRYLFVFEERHLRKFQESRFSILDRVRQIVAGERMPATVSIGVGRGGATFAQSEEQARQALDMALGRGGDQAAVKSQGGFEFFGGVSKAVEKRTKVKTRIIASALAELIDGSDNVLIMGHRNADLDSLGASVALYRASMSRGTNARIVVNTQNTFVQQAIADLQKLGYSEAFLSPPDSLAMVTRRTLLIVVDTHRKGYIEYPELYQAVKTVAVIDHHRKMVDFIDNAVIFYHETYASSASEMVAELMQYLADDAVTSVEAGSLLAGITLDTRNFAVRTGVRTFEAAAYLRRKGADTARVKQLFSGTMENYRKRAELVASAESYKSCAIAGYSGQPESDLILVSAQAADDLLTITGVKASMVLFPTADGISVSARSMGEVNVQLIMETLGGGGHLTMAGTQMPKVGMIDAKARLKAAVDKYFEENTKAREG